MIRTTVMLPPDVHARLRRLARRRGVPLAHVIRDALSRTAEEERAEPFSFIGAASVSDPTGAASLGDAGPPLTPPVADAPSPDEITHFRALAEKIAADC